MKAYACIFAFRFFLHFKNCFTNLKGELPIAKKSVNVKKDSLKKNKIQDARQPLITQINTPSQLAGGSRNSLISSIYTS